MNISKDLARNLSGKADAIFDTIKRTNGFPSRAELDGLLEFIKPLETQLPDNTSLRSAFRQFTSSVDLCTKSNARYEARLLIARENGEKDPEWRATTDIVENFYSAYDSLNAAIKAAMPTA